jgi:hypothetical protein
VLRNVFYNKNYLSFVRHRRSLKMNEIVHLLIFCMYIIININSILVDISIGFALANILIEISSVLLCNLIYRNLL